MNRPTRAQEALQVDAGPAEIAACRLDASTGTIWRGGKNLPLRAKTLAVLRYLMERAGTIVSREELREEVWGKKHGNLDGPKQCVRELRAALNDVVEPARFIETVGRRGYRFVGALEVIGAKQDDTSVLASPAVLRPACVGRAKEADDLAGGLTRARRGGRAIYFLAGEPGAGKTTLVDHFLSAIANRDDTWIARGQCVPNFGVHQSYGPLLDAVEQLAADPARRDFVQLIRNHAPSWLTQLPAIFDPREISERRGELAGTGPQRMLRELTDIFERMTQLAPGIVVLEDLHWSDTATLGWISAWALRRAPARLMVIGTFRSDEVAGGDRPLSATLRELQRCAGYLRIDLAGLSAEAVTEYLENRFALHDLAPRLGAALTRRTEGHPLFVTALIGEWLTRGDLYRSGGSWALRGEIADLADAIPENARALIDHQISRLTAAERRLLEIASVAGQQFSAAVLTQEASNVPVIEQQCEDLARREFFLCRMGPEVWPDETVAARYGFRHALYQQALYEQLPVATRNQLHRQIGLRLESVYGTRTPEIASALADHFDRAGDHRRCALYSRMAGEAALQRRAAIEAIEHLQRALRHLSMSPEDRSRSDAELSCQLSLGLSFMVGQRLVAPDVGMAYRRARQLAVELADVPRLIRASRGLWEHCMATSDVGGMKAVSSEMAGTIETLPQTELAMWCHNMIGQTRWVCGEPGRSISHIGAVISHYDSGRHADPSIRVDSNPAVQCHTYATIILQLLGRSEASEQHFNAGMAISRALRQPFGTAHLIWSGAVAAYERRDIAAVRQRGQELMALSERAQMDYWLLAGHVFIGWAAVAEGDRSGLDQIRHDLNSERSAASCHWLAMYADACWRCGLPEEGLSAVAVALDRAFTTGAHWYSSELLRLRGVLKLQTSGSEARKEAIGDIEQAMALARSQGALYLERRAAADLAGTLGN